MFTYLRSDRRSFLVFSSCTTSLFISVSDKASQSRAKGSGTRFIFSFCIYKASPCLIIQIFFIDSIQIIWKSNLNIIWIKLIFAKIWIKFGKTLDILYFWAIRCINWNQHAHWEELLQSVSNFIFRNTADAHPGVSRDQDFMG